MPAYVTFLIDIHDEAAFRDYARAAAPTYEVYDGSVALRGPITEILEGTLEVKPGTRLVVLQFPSVEQSRAWWQSEQYQALIKLRLPPTSDSRVFLVDGIDIDNRR
jgi:uncharacterized protein (DUF1330 family)